MKRNVKTQKSKLRASNNKNLEAKVQEIEAWLESPEGRKAVKEAIDEAARIPSIFSKVRPVNPAKFSKPVTL